VRQFCLGNMPKSHPEMMGMNIIPG